MRRGHTPAVQPRLSLNMVDSWSNCGLNEAMETLIGILLGTSGVLALFAASLITDRLVPPDMPQTSATPP